MIPRIMTPFVFVTALLLHSAARSQAVAPGKLSAARATAVDAAVAAEIKKQNLVGVAVGILQDGKIAYLKGYGLADREKKVPVTTKSVFNWASNSKLLAAVAAIQLVQSGRLDLDADIHKYVPEYPKTSSVITVRHLLCHQSGIPHYSNGKIIPTKREYKSKDPFADCVNALDKFNQSPLIFEPGSKMAYSSYAYILLSAVIQKAGQASFDDQVKTRIATPLGMKSLQLDVATKGQANWVVGYTKSGRDPAVVVAPEEANYWKQGAGGYKSNVEDFARWAQGLLSGKLVSREIEKQMWTRQKTSDGKSTNYGLGFVVSEKAYESISHGGSQRETRTYLVIHPKTKDGVVVLCNCGFANVFALSSSIEKALQGVPSKP